MTDGRGLCLEVLPSGNFSWVFRYRFKGRPEKVSLGRYPDLSLKSARIGRDKQGHSWRAGVPLRRRNGWPGWRSQETARWARSPSATITILCFGIARIRVIFHGTGIIANRELQKRLTVEISPSSRGWFALSNLGSLLIVGIRNSVRPIHVFDHNRDHDYFFELPCQKGSGIQYR